MLKEMFFSMEYVNAVVRFQFLTLDRFSDKCVFQVSGSASTKKTRTWVVKKPREIQQLGFYSTNTTALYTVHTKDMAGPFHFNNETVKQVDYSQMLDTLVRSEAQQFSQNTVSQQDGARPNVTGAVCSPLVEIFRRLRIGTHGPTRWPAKLPNITPMLFFPWGLVRDKVYQTSVLSFSHLNRMMSQNRHSESS